MRLRLIATTHTAFRALVALTVASGRAAAQQGVPDIPFDAKADYLVLPPGIAFGEVSGIALNSKRHAFVFVRTGVNTTVHGAAASQLFEFGAGGQFYREIGKNLYGFAFAHTVRIDKDDNIWTTDEGTNMVVRFNPAGKVTLVLGRRAEAVEAESPAHVTDLENWKPHPPRPCRPHRVRPPKWWRQSRRRH